eukprot:8097393-Alexandrium_andersonii.AAC.1
MPTGSACDAWPPSPGHGAHPRATCRSAQTSHGACCGWVRHPAPSLRPQPATVSYTHLRAHETSAHL